MSFEGSWLSSLGVNSDDLLVVGCPADPLSEFGPRDTVQPASTATVSRETASRPVWNSMASLQVGGGPSVTWPRRLYRVNTRYLDFPG